MNRLYAWGHGLKDQAFGRSAVLWKPTVLDEFDGDIRGVAVSQNRIVAWDSAGSTYSWYQADGKTGTRSWELEPKLPQGYGVLEASCSDNHIVALGESGSVYCWGLNQHGELGTDGRSESKTPLRLGTKFNSVSTVCAAADVSLILSDRGEATAWGRDDGFRIMSTSGRAARKGGLESPEQLIQLCKRTLAQHVITKVACGGTHSAAVTNQGMLLTWGHDRFGQLGHGSLPEQAENERRGQGTPVRVVQYFDEIFITDVACGDAHTIALDDMGKMYSWGWNAYGQLGLANTSNRQIPKMIPAKQPVRSVSAGFAHSLAITQNELILAWGWGQFGQLGTEKAVNSASPRLLEEMPGVSQVLQVGCGRDFSVALVVGNYGDDASATPKDKEPYTDVAGSEITLIRKLEDLKQQLGLATEYSQGSDEEIRSINEEISVLHGRIQVVDDQIEEIRQEELELAAFVPHESWPFERQERELKVVLGQQEEEYLREKELLEELRNALNLQEDQPEMDSMSDLHADMGNLKRELEWHTNEQLRIFEQLELRKLAAKVDLEDQVVLLRQRAEGELNSLKNSTNLGKDLSGLYHQKAELLQAIKACEQEANQTQKQLGTVRGETQSLKLQEMKKEQEDNQEQWMHQLELTHDMKKKVEIAAAEIHVGKVKANEDREQMKADAQHVQKQCQKLAEELAQQPQMIAEIRLADLSLDKYEADKDGISQAFKEDIAQVLEVDPKDVEILEVSEGSLVIKFSVKGDKEATESKLQEQHQDNNSMLYEGQVTHSTDPSFLTFHTPSADEILTRIRIQVRGADPPDEGSDSDISIDEPIVWTTPPKPERPVGQTDVEASADVKGPSVDVKGPSVDVKGPSVDVEAGADVKVNVDVKGPSLDVEGPSLDVEGPSVDVEAGADVKVDVKGPSVDVKGPSVDVEGPSVDVEAGADVKVDVDVKGPSLDVKGPSLDVEGPSVDVEAGADVKVDVKGPSVDVKGPSLDVKGPSLDVKGPSLDVEGPSVDVEAGADVKVDVDVKGPSVGVKGPSVDVEAGADVKVDVEGPSVDVKGPSVDVKGPSVDVKGPSVDVEAGADVKVDVDVKGPSLDVEGPSLDVKGPSVDVEAGADVKVDVEGPSVDVKGPSVDVEAGADVKVDVKGPSLDVEAGADVKVDVKGPSLDVKGPSLDVKGPSVDVKGPSVDVEAGADVKVDVKGPSLDVKGPSADVEAGADVKVDVKGPSVDVEAGADVKVNIDVEGPSVGANVTQAETKTVPAWFGGGDEKKSASHIEEALQAALAATSEKIADVIASFDELGGGMEKEIWLHSWEFLASNEFGENLEHEFAKVAGDRHSITFTEFFPMFHAKMGTYNCDVNEEYAGATFKQVDDDGSGEVGVDSYLLCCFLLVSHMKLKAGESRLENFQNDIKIRAAAANEKLRDSSPSKSRWATAKAKSTFAKVRSTAMASQFTTRLAAGAAKDKFAANVRKRSPERERNESPPK